MQRQRSVLTALASFGGLAICFSLVACSSNEKTPPRKVDKAEVAKDKAKGEISEPAPPAEPFRANPNAKPPPPPPGAVLLDPPKGVSDPRKSIHLYVQTCSKEHPCPKILQTEAEIHCREFALGAREHGWRLPSRHEADRFGSLEGLENQAGYHWTRTPFEQDMMQVWIVDPSGEGQSTTIPRKRKPFTARCVLEP